MIFGLSWEGVAALFELIVRFCSQVSFQLSEPRLCHFSDHDTIYHEIINLSIYEYIDVLRPSSDILQSGGIWKQNEKASPLCVKYSLSSSSFH